MYDKESVEASFRARLHPTDNTVPECVCVIAIAGSHIYVSEDDDEGTFTDHYISEYAQIEDIRVSLPYKASVNLYEEPNTLAEKIKNSFGVRNGLVGKLLGPKEDESSSKNGKIGSPRAKYFEIVYYDENDKKESLFFNEWDRNPNAFISRFKELTDRS